MDDAPRNSARPRKIAGESRREGRHWESLRASVRRANFAAVEGGASRPELRLPVLVRARHTAEGIRALYFLAEEFRGRIAPGCGPSSAHVKSQAVNYDTPEPSADNSISVKPHAATNRDLTAYAEALLRLAAPSVKGVARADALEREILGEGRIVGTLLLTVETQGPALCFRATLWDGQDPLVVGQSLRVKFHGGPTLTAPLEPAGAQFSAAAILVLDRDLTSLAIDFSPFGTLRLEPEVLPRQG